MTCLGIAVAFGLYVGSYFLCVSQVRFGITRGSTVSIASTYRYVPGWMGAPMVYRPIHLLDRKYLRHPLWQDRPAHAGELSGSIARPRQVIFSIPITTAP